MHRNRYLIILLTLICLTGLLNPLEKGAEPAVWPFGRDLLDELTPEEIRQKEYFRMEDEEGRIILETGRRIRKGDSFLAEDNRLYKVYEVKDKIAKARYEETVKIDVDLPSWSPGLNGSTSAPGKQPRFENTLRAYSRKTAANDEDDGGNGNNDEPNELEESDEPGEPDEDGEDRREDEDGGGGEGNGTEEQPAFLIALYHTHNGESYLPTEGAESEYGPGGVHVVGSAMKNALEAKGINVIHSEDMHLPHDRGAYRRSRSTAWGLVRREPDAVFDLHRDAAPAEAYEHEIDGLPVTRIMIVVGQANPNFSVNRKFAYDLKGYADDVYPGLMRGVYMAQGSYNQDLSPMNLLLEVGSYLNPRQEAERGITRFADVVGYYFYGPEFIDIEERDGTEARDRVVGEQRMGKSLPPARYRDAGGVSSAVSGTVIGLILASLLALLSFFFINNPEEGRRVIHWFKQLPANTRTAYRQSVIFIKDLPATFRALWDEFPDNLRADYQTLVEEIKRTPAALSQFAVDSRDYFRDRADTAPEIIENLRLNWHESVSLLREEAREIYDRIRQALRERK